MWSCWVILEGGAATVAPTTHLRRAHKGRALEVDSRHTKLEKQKIVQSGLRSDPPFPANLGAQIGSSNSYPKDGNHAGEDLQRSTVRETKSPRPLTAHPRKAKPRHRLATVAGAKAMTEVKRGLGSALRMMRRKEGRGCIRRWLWVLKCATMLLVSAHMWLIHC
ncbi:hypothetical protein ACLB2K_063730 [Fragaria x ananassa]